MRLGICRPCARGAAELGRAPRASSTTIASVVVGTRLGPAARCPRQPATCAAAVTTSTATPPRAATRGDQSPTGAPPRERQRASHASRQREHDGVGQPRLRADRAGSHSRHERHDGQRGRPRPTRPATPRGGRAAREPAAAGDDRQRRRRATNSHACLFGRRAAGPPNAKPRERAQRRTRSLPAAENSTADREILQPALRRSCDEQPPQGRQQQRAQPAESAARPRSRSPPVRQQPQRPAAMAAVARRCRARGRAGTGMRRRRRHRTTDDRRAPGREARPPRRPRCPHARQQHLRVAVAARRGENLAAARRAADDDQRRASHDAQSAVAAAPTATPAATTRNSVAGDSPNSHRASAEITYCSGMPRIDEVANRPRRRAASAAPARRWK